MKVFKFILLLLLSTSVTYSFDISQMSLEEKVGQLFLVYFDGEDANKHAERLIREAKMVDDMPMMNTAMTQRVNAENSKAPTGAGSRVRGCRKNM